MGRARLVPALLVALAMAGCDSTGEPGGCAAPGVDPVQPASAAGGDVITVSGRYFLSEVTVDDEGTFTTKAAVPERLVAGPAEIPVDYPNSYGATLTMVG
ncbi:hypothetical protein ACIB24_19285 [Spongisporangium articulatum]|uniref:IPT/TIG domain-containing protein n=1 Tax=Spongisporangium articulatum TaxID=3362603 RepID=A0ABW8AS41_9ACTN